MPETLTHRVFTFYDDDSLCHFLDKDTFDIVAVASGRSGWKVVVRYRGKDVE